RAWIWMTRRDVGAPARISGYPPLSNDIALASTGSRSSAAPNSSYQSRAPSRSMCGIGQLLCCRGWKRGSAALDRGCGPDECDRVRVARCREHGLGIAALDDDAIAQHDEVVRDLAHDCEVVRDE